MSDVLIKSEHVSKKFCRSLKRSLWYGVKDVTHSLNPWAHSQEMDSSGDLITKAELRPDEFWALQDINFEVRRGECLGLIGHNGAGKSTLLKILNGLIRPDSGRITMRGRVGALIELSAGFNPILTGRENIYTQAALLGFSPQETRQKFDAIVSFAELEQFIDMPLQNYSSGMNVRLGFAVSSQMEPDILLIDEVLAVGDVGFRTKCLARIGELSNRTAFIFVSHSMPQVARIASQIMHLDHGKTKILTNSIPDAIASYYGGFAGCQTQRTGNGLVEIERFLATARGSTVTESQQLKVGYGDDIEFEMTCVFRQPCHDATISMVIWNQEMAPVMDVLGSDMTRVPLAPGPNGCCTLRTRIPKNQFNTGNYTVTVAVSSADAFQTYCRVDHIVEIIADSNQGSACTFVLCAEWTQEAASAVLHEIAR